MKLAWNKLPLLVLSLTLGTPGVAQVTVVPTRPEQPEQSEDGGSLPAEAAASLEQARAAAERARASVLSPSPDRPDWRSAIDLGEGARAAAPTNPEVLRFLGETYSAVAWHSRAWEAWEAYLAAGGTLDAEAVAGLMSAGQQLGFARYSGGDLTGADEIFQRVLELDPENPLALTWLGRIALESGRSDEAERYWRRVLDLQPGNETARYYLNRAQQQRTFGPEASEAFNAGLAAYDADRKDEALEAFSRAAETNPTFDEAFSWAGRVALELGRPQVATSFWEALATRNPEDQRAQYFLELAESQERWGSAAGRAFYAGQELYNRGQVRAAAERFVAASEANPQYPAAASWAARSLQESGQAQRAVRYWQRVVSLSPDDPSARFFLEAAQAQENVSGDALSAFNQGVQAYQEADLEAAENSFRTATERDPTYADAWGWLGRLAFENQHYDEAEAAYARAAELEPDNTTYSFFLSEAQRLATP